MKTWFTSVLYAVVWLSPADTSVTGIGIATSRGTFSAPSRPRAPSSLQPQVKTFPRLESATVCMPPHTILRMLLAGCSPP